MGFKLSYISDIVQGRLIGDDLTVNGVSSLANASENDLTFLFQKKFLEQAIKSPAKAFIVAEGLEVEGKSYIIVKNPSLAQAKILQLFYPEKMENMSVSEKSYIAPTVELHHPVTVKDFAFIEDNTIIGEGSVVYPYVFIGKNVKVGRNVKIFPHVAIMDDTEIGDNAIIYPGAVVGADGFGYAFDGTKYVKIPQVGKVVIENEVEIGANTTIDRATMDETRIGAGTKIDNQCMIAHNVTIGQNSVFAAQVGIAGSTKIGSYVIMGGKVGVKDHVNIGDRVQVGGMSGIMNDLDSGTKIAGIPAMSYVKWLKIQSIIEKLPELKKELERLVKIVDKEEKD